MSRRFQYRYERNLSHGGSYTRRVGRSRIYLFLTVLFSAVVVTAMALFSGKASRVNAAFQERGIATEISEAAQNQIQVLLQEKQSRTPEQRKIDSQLLYAARMNRRQAIAAYVQRLETDIEVDRDGKVLVDIKAKVTKSLLDAMTGMQAEIVNHFKKDVRARIPLNRIEEFASLPKITFIMPAAEMETNSNLPDELMSANSRRGITNSSLLPVLPSGFEKRAASVRRQMLKALTGSGRQKAVKAVFTPAMLNTSEGDVAHRAAEARATFGVNGTGVRVGVLSDGVDSLASLQASGDLPAGITVIPGQAGSGDEGSAMLEIVFDLAPGAQLFFATGGGGPANFANNIRALRTAGCDIIVDDIFYIAESAFQDGQAASVSSTTNGGAIAQAVNDVTAAGALYFSSAGNAGNVDDGTAGCWEGDFNSGGTLAAVPGGNVHDFGGGVVGNPITVLGSPVLPASLFWSDPLGGSSNDYDLFVLNSTLTTVVGSSTNVQSGTQDPYEQVPMAAIAVGNRIVILQKTGAANRALHLNMNRGRLSISTPGQAKGHPSGANAYSVAAVDVATAGGGIFTGGAANPVEAFSSDGPRRMLLSADGTAITPGNLSASGGVLRQKPDVTAADGVSCAAPGFGSFFGTSAAAPHAAAIAALVRSFNPALTPAQVRTSLTTTALDIMAAGIDRDSGFGIEMAFQALVSVSRADLHVSKTVSSPAIAGNNITYTITIRNDGPDTAVNVALSDPLPSNATFQSSTCPSGWTCAAPSVGSRGGTLTATKPTVANGEAASFTITIKICPEVLCNTNTANTATVSSDSPDPAPGNNSSTATSNVQTRSDLSVAQSAPTIAVSGCTASFTLTVANAGPSNDANPTVIDTLPAGWIVISASATQGTSSGVGSGTAIFNLGPLGATGQCTTTIPTTATITIVAQVPLNQGPGMVTNTATVSTGNCLADPILGNNTAVATITVFDISVQDETNPDSQLIFRSDTGDYHFCCAGAAPKCGTGTLTKRGGSITLVNFAATHTVNAKVDISSGIGTAALKSPNGDVMCLILDKNVTDNTACTCAGQSCP